MWSVKRSDDGYDGTVARWHVVLVIHQVFGRTYTGGAKSLHGAKNEREKLSKAKKPGGVHDCSLG